MFVASLSKTPHPPPPNDICYHFLGRGWRAEWTKKTLGLQRWWICCKRLCPLNRWYILGKVDFSHSIERNVIDPLQMLWPTFLHFSLKKVHMTFLTQLIYVKQINDSRYIDFNLKKPHLRRDIKVPACSVSSLEAITHLSQQVSNPPDTGGSTSNAPPQNCERSDDCFIMRVVTLIPGIVFLNNPMNGGINRHHGPPRQT